jgi:hypothetical protein
MTAFDDPTAGTVLGEEERRLLASALLDASVASGHAVPNGRALVAMTDVVSPIVAALLSSAREAGRNEGAEAEQERIHDEIAERQHSELAATIPPAGSPTQAYDYARRIARGA